MSEGNLLMFMPIVLGAAILAVLIIWGFVNLFDFLKKKKDTESFTDASWKDGVRWEETEKEASGEAAGGDTSREGSAVRYHGFGKNDNSGRKGHSPREAEELYTFSRSGQGMQECPVCGVENSSDREYCDLCGARLK